MRAREGTGRTIEEARAVALAELGLEVSQVTVEVLDEPRGGFLGIWGGRLARVLVRPERFFFCRHFLQEILKAADLETIVKLRDEPEVLRLEVEGEGVSFLIGRRGETLDSLQYLVNVASSRVCGKGKEILLDIKGYRQQHEAELYKLAQEAAEEVLKAGDEVVLRTMQPRDRKIIHMSLQDHPGVTTRSQGEEPRRAVVVFPRN